MCDTVHPIGNAATIHALKIHRMAAAAQARDTHDDRHRRRRVVARRPGRSTRARPPGRQTTQPQARQLPEHLPGG